MYPKIGLDALDSLQVIRVNSQIQKIVNKNQIVLEGDVEVLVDTSIHIWADKVFIDKEKKTVEAYALNKSSVVFERNDILILSDYIFLNLEQKTGHADNVRIHLEDGYLSSKKAEKVKENKWHFKHITYTACDKPKPDWKITISDVWMKNNVVYLYGLPVLRSPLIMASSDERSNSGFLIPRLSYTKKFGPGLIQEYYWDISENFDTTMGVNWKDKKGFVLYDEFRHSTGQDEFSSFNVQYARDKKAVINRDRYWILGKHFHTLKMKDLILNNLTCLDFGTDKRIGYDFFYRTDAIEDKFNNALISRLHGDNNLVSFSIDQKKIFRNKFFFSEGNIFREEDSFKVTRLPRLEWNSNYWLLKDGLYYKNDFFVDQIFSRKRNFDTQITPNPDNAFTEKLDTVRFYYQGSFSKVFNLKNNVFSFDIEPNLQIRNRLKDIDLKLTNKNVFEKKIGREGVFRAFVKTNAEWALPEATYFGKNYKHYFQPLFKWNFIPKFNQDHWIHSDIWDREYPKNELSLSLRSDWHFKNAKINFTGRLAEDFYVGEDIFPLRRSPFSSHLLPLELQSHIDTENIRLGFLQEYDLKTATLLNSTIDIGFSFMESDFYASMLYQNPELQVSRELLSDIPAFANLGFRIPVYRNIRLSYDSNFYSPSNSFFGVFRDSDALLHRIRFELKGHCWGASVGFEEKRYRRDGNVKSEQSYFLSFKLDSIGKVAHHFRKDPEILDAPPDY
ncbi:LPS-assembly protein LptD [Candidatus Babeliales bacterium]|nr:LPS-assembly protein LptD [Candidatus Babeliales bacterium]